MRFFRLQRIVCIFAQILVLGSVVAIEQQSADCQETTASMVGTVTDSSGAAVPGATVTLVNTTTGAKYTETSNSIGTYRFANIPPGQGYEATFTAKGFAAFKVTSIYLTVDSVRTQNATLAVGTQVSTVQVTAANSEVTIDTTSASVGNTFDVQQLNNLPVQQRNDPLALFAMQPGVTDSGAVTGARVDQNFVTVDGLDVNNFANGGADQSNTNAGISTQLGTIVGHAPVDSVEEFKGDVAGNDASTGLGGGGQFALVTKSGTNTFHGNLNEYNRNTSFVANPWFSNNAGVPRAHYIQNQFGGNVGGPVSIPHLFSGKDKLFFFFDFNDSRIINNIVQNRVVPSDTLRAGTITYCTDPLCDTTDSQTMAQVSAFDPAGKGVDQTWLNYVDARFPHSNSSSGGDGLNSLGYTFTAPNNDNEVNYVGRGDWTINDKMKLFAKFAVAREDAVEQPNQFPGDPVTSPYTDRSYDFVIGHDWILGSTKTNHFFIGDVVDKEAFPIDYDPTGNIAFTFGDGADQSLTSNPYIWPGASARRVPIEQLGDNFAWIAGKHTLQFGGRVEDILAHDATTIDYNTTEIGLGGQVFSLCGPAVNDCGTGNPSLRPSDLDLSNKLSWDEPFAFLLGRIGSVSSDYNYNAKGQSLTQLTGDQRFYKYYQTEFFGMDTWKVIPSLSVTYGVTYQWFSVPYETRGLESVEPYSFNQYFLARLMQSNNGQSGAGTVPLIPYLLGGKGNGAGAPGLYQPQYKNFGPHLGFAWNPGFDKKLVINGSADITYDRTVIFAIQGIQDQYSYLFQQTKGNSYGTQGDPYDSLKNDPRLDSFTTPYSQLAGTNALNLTPPATPTPPYDPFSGTYCAGYNYSPCGLQDGLAFNSTIDPTLKVPYNVNFNFGIERQIPWDMVLKLSYAGRLGRRLLAQEDANQVLDFADPQSGQLYSQAFAYLINQTRAGVAPANLTPQPWFEDVVSPSYPGATNCAYTTNTQCLAAGVGGYIFNGDFGDFTQAISPFVPANVGSASQFSENTFYDSAGFSNYDALLLTLQKNISHGVHFDFNYTWSHSIDNVSIFANSLGDTGIGGIGLVCDAIHPRECRASSDFDARHYITSDATYQLPFGKGRMLLATQPRWIDEIVGAWDVSGLTEWHTGYPWSGASNAFVASYSNDAPPIFIGTNPGAIKTGIYKLPGGGVSSFANAGLASKQFEGPVGFQIGPRNSFRGPGFFNADLGLAKNFPITTERVNLRFRADAFNALNHPNFQNPPENAFNGYDAQDYQRGSGFGEMFFTVNPSGNNNDGARVLQLSLRLEF
ncbi:MAG: carboxypeptidase-like regulatory domain-containing protein [Terracidiphilus sp.]